MADGITRSCDRAARGSDDHRSRAQALVAGIRDETFRVLPIGEKHRETRTPPDQHPHAGSWSLRGWVECGGCDDGAAWLKSSKGRRHVHCVDCDGSGRLPWNPRDLVRLKAFAGDPAARLVEDACENECGLHSQFPRATWRLHDECALGLYGMDKRNPSPTIERWLMGAQRLASKLPAWEGPEEECDYWCHDEHGPDCTCCPFCNGTGHRTQVVPFERLYMTRLAVAAGRAALKNWEAQGGASCEQCGWMCFCPRRALAAAEAWCRCPCEANARPCEAACHHATLPRWAQAGQVAFRWDDATPSEVARDVILAATKAANQEIVMAAVRADATNWPIIEVGA